MLTQSANTIIRRTWQKAITDSSSTGHRILWDLGNEVWEIIDQGSKELRHFQIISRKMNNHGDKVTMEEVITILPECPIPVNTIRHSIGPDWEITEYIEQPPLLLEKQPLQPLKREKTLPLPLHHQQQNLQALPRHQQRVQAKAQGLQVQGLQVQNDNQHQHMKDSPPMLKKTSRRQMKQQLQPLNLQDSDSEQQQHHESEQQQQKDSQHPLTQTKNSKKTKDSSSESSQQSHNSKQLWSSLSQWIPATALYQPSLHQQAVLDLLEKTVHIQFSPKRYQSQTKGQGKFVKHRPLTAPFASQGPLFL